MEKKPETVGIIAPVTGETDEVQDNTLGNGVILTHQKERNTGSPEPQTSGESSRKRKVKFESNKKASKRLKRLRLKKKSLRKNQAEGKCSQPSGPNLTDLPDELLLVVLRSLPPRDVRSLGQVSSRFANVVADHSLWISPDFRHQRGLTCEKFCERYMPFLGPWTTSMATRGALQSLRVPRLLPKSSDYLSAEFLNKLQTRCPNLKSLVLRDHCIDVREVFLGRMPLQIERLVFRRCSLLGSYFSGLHTALPHLQEVELNRCPWFNPDLLLALSRCAHLKILRITQSPSIFGSIWATRQSCLSGFQNLEVLDLRHTFVGDLEMMIVSQLQRLEELLLEYPDEDDYSSDSSDENEMLCPDGMVKLKRQPPLNSCCCDHKEDTSRVPRLREFLSDMGVSFLGSGVFLIPNMIAFRTFGFVCQTGNNLRLRKLVVRGFTGVTDRSVRYLAQVPTLRYLDLTGCAVTQCALKTFAAFCPDVEVPGLQRYQRCGFKGPHIKCNCNCI